MRTFLRDNISPILFILLTGAVFFLTVHSRASAVEKGWHENRAVYYVGDTPMVNTLDAYRFVHNANEYESGVYNYDTPDYSMYYPDGLYRPAPVPLLAVMLVKLSRFFDGNKYEAGLHLVPLLAGLFILPFALYFYRLKLPLAGIIGGFLGAFSSVYYGRSTAGRIDTDTLNLFFMCLTPLLIFLSAESEKRRGTYIYACLAGVSQLLFVWWYHHYSFAGIFWGVLIITLLLYRKDKLTVAVSALIYLLTANPKYILFAAQNFLGLAKAYIIPETTLGGGYPNVYNTVSEAQGAGALNVLGELFVNSAVSLALLLTLLIMGYIYRKRLFPLLPTLLLGLVTFRASMRFALYLLPFMGAALGFILHKALSYTPVRERLKDLMGYTAAAAFFFAVFMLPGKIQGVVPFFIPAPSIPPYLYNSFNVLKEYTKENAAIFTWWDFGHALEANGFAAFHDGASQNTPKTWIIARGFVKDEDTLAKTATYLANNGALSILKSKTPAKEALAIIDNYTEPLWKDKVYIFFTYDMIQKFGAIEYIGGWDLERQTPPQRPGYITLNCEPTEGVLITCSDGRNRVRVNRELGLIYQGERPEPIRALASVKNGSIIKEVKNPAGAEIYGALLGGDGKSGGFSSKSLIIMSREQYESSFVELFFFGRYDKKRYREVVNMFPIMRLYKLNYTGSLPIAWLHRWVRY